MSTSPGVNSVSICCNFNVWDNSHSHQRLYTPPSVHLLLLCKRAHCFSASNTHIIYASSSPFLSLLSSSEHRSHFYWQHYEQLGQQLAYLKHEGLNLLCHLRTSKKAMDLLISICMKCFKCKSIKISLIWGVESHSVPSVALSERSMWGLHQICMFSWGQLRARNKSRVFRYCKVISGTAEVKVDQQTKPSVSTFNVTEVELWLWWPQPTGVNVKIFKRWVDRLKH